MSTHSPFQKKIGIIGSGSWGTALALLLARSYQEVLLWGHRPEHIKTMRETRRNHPYLPQSQLPKNIYPTDNLEEMANTAILFFVVPSSFLLDIAKQLRPYLMEKAAQSLPIISCTKSLDYRTGKVMSELLSEQFPDQMIGALSGPNLAHEIAAGLPAAGVLAGQNRETLQQIAALFPQNYYRTYLTHDWKGTQLGGALKNIFAIASGITDGMKMGANARAALVNRSLAEMQRLGVALGGERETFQGLSGIGDLMLTCFSPESRNYRAGKEIAFSGKTAEQIITESQMVIEGFKAAKSAQHIAHQHGIDTPIIDQVVALIDGKTTPHIAIEQLLSRPLRSEKE